MPLQASARSLALTTFVSCLVILEVGTSYVSTASGICCERLLPALQLPE